MSSSLKLLSVFATSLMILACSKDDDPQVNPIPGPVSATFVKRELTLNENDEPIEISVSLAKPATREGVIFIKVTGEDENDFTTSPAVEDGMIQLPVSAGQSTVKFILTPVDDQLDADDKSIQFVISSVSDGFIIGNEKVLSATIVDNESPAVVNFLLNTGSTRENSAGSSIMISFSHAAPGTGAIEISFTSPNAVYGTHFTTQPEAVNGKINIPVEVGVNHVSFNVIPINDQLFNETRNVTYTISEVQGALSKGEGVAHELLITDDELEGKYKGYTIIAGNWSYKKKYEYNEEGVLSKVTWEQNTPGYSTGTFIYHYNEAGQVIKRVESAYRETIYTWQEGRIIKAEKFNDGILKQYTLYGYDNTGNIGESAIHDLQPDGEFKLSLLFVYLYNLNGNIYKQLTYSPIDGSEDYTLVSTRTYDNYYLHKENPFSMIEILPNVNSQPNLPGSYRVEENNFNILYQFSYEFDETGRPAKRTATSSAGSEVAYYEYY